MNQLESERDRRASIRCKTRAEFFEPLEFVLMACAHHLTSVFLNWYPGRIASGSRVVIMVPMKFD